MTLFVLAAVYKVAPKTAPPVKSSTAVTVALAIAANNIVNTNVTPLSVILKYCADS